ncbi:uncharacterized protein [Montipora foliosa]|uniref:uncharacterized protein isoform X2 n=1 Tax=Montipora foliosa TaxID=591990 RepID=UPI0035F16EA4
MLPVKLSLHILTFGIMWTMVDTVSSLELSLEVTLNGTSIPWKNEISEDRKSSKELVVKVRNNLYNKLQSVVKVSVQAFYKGEDGNTLCELQFKMTAIDCGWEIERELNGTVDIGFIGQVMYTGINMSLELSSVFETEYKDLSNNLTRIKAALTIVYLSYDDVVDFEIYPLSKGNLDGTVLVEFRIMVFNDTELSKKDLKNILDRFTRDKSFRKLLFPEKSPGVLVKTMVVLGAMVISLVMIVFSIRVIKVYCKNERESQENRLEVAPEQTEETPTALTVQETILGLIPEAWTMQRQPIVAWTLPHHQDVNESEHPFLIETGAYLERATSIQRL